MHSCHLLEYKVFLATFNINEIRITTTRKSTTLRLLHFKLIALQMVFFFVFSLSRLEIYFKYKYLYNFTFQILYSFCLKVARAIVGSFITTNMSQRVKNFRRWGLIMIKQPLIFIEITATTTVN